MNIKCNIITLLSFLIFSIHAAQCENEHMDEDTHAIISDIDTTLATYYGFPPIASFLLQYGTVSKDAAFATPILNQPPITSTRSAFTKKEYPYKVCQTLLQQQKDFIEQYQESFCWVVNPLTKAAQGSLKMCRMKNKSGGVCGVYITHFRQHLMNHCDVYPYLCSKCKIGFKSTGAVVHDYTSCNALKQE